MIELENCIASLYSSFSSFEMIKAILVFNNHGKPRMTKFFVHYVSSLPSLVAFAFFFTSYASINTLECR